MWNVRICIQLSALISIFIKHQYMVCIPHTNKRSVIYEIRRNDVGGVFVSIQTTWNGSTRAYIITTSPSTSHHKVIPEWLLHGNKTSVLILFLRVAFYEDENKAKNVVFFTLIKCFSMIASMKLWKFLELFQSSLKASNRVRH